MALLKDAIEEKKFDVRMKQKNVTRGVITDEEAESHSKNLPELTNELEWVNTENLKHQDVR